MREKLIELLNEAEEWADHKCDKLECKNCPADKMKSNCVQQLMVDRLIANGVRLEEKQATSDESKWIPVTERLPEEEMEVIVYTGNILKPSVFCYHFWTADLLSWQSVTHWMHLPEPPKGE